ncbi:hypothetical protein PAECIP111802_06922 [Paenibacillus allorhizosphaerae]|uniref:Uncharacterized protein n=1 Tax=Paenibacillus allorhizosphaerae TaxID=2849866 RepID=A0ABM8VTQ0_9BACL|nr:hypothetical protein PAECIP111802_06922 [Paenibacillus allorhizosphaerae]
MMTAVTFSSFTMHSKNLAIVSVEKPDWRGFKMISRFVFSIQYMVWIGLNTRFTTVLFFVRMYNLSSIYSRGLRIHFGHDLGLLFYPVMYFGELISLPSLKEKHVDHDPNHQ